MRLPKRVSVRRYQELSPEALQLLEFKTKEKIKDTE